MGMALLGGRLLSLLSSSSQRAALGAVCTGWTHSVSPIEIAQVSSFSSLPEAEVEPEITPSLNVPSTSQDIELNPTRFPNAPPPRKRRAKRVGDVVRPFCVTKHTLVHKAAGAFATEVRDGACVVSLATGTEAVNQTVKALCIARHFLEGDPGMDLYFRVSHQPGANRDRISQVVFGVWGSKDFLEPEHVEELRVGALKRGREIGASIASIVQNGSMPLVRAIGPRAVGNAIVGATWARRFLRREGMDILCFPEFKTVTLPDKGERASVNMWFKSIPYEWVPEIDSNTPLIDVDVETEVG